MIKPKPAIVIGNDPRLNSFAVRLDNIEEERKALGDDAKSVYSEVKGVGYNTKALRKVLAERRKEPDPQFEADLELYRAALAVPGATYRAVAEQYGVPKSNLHRLVPKDARGTRPMVEADLGEWLQAPAGPAKEITPKATPACIYPRPAAWVEITSAREAFEAAREAERLAKIEERRIAREALAAKNRAIDADKLEIPSFLKATKQDAEASVSPERSEAVHA